MHEVATILHSIGFTAPEESDDTIIEDETFVKAVDEHLSEFLAECISISNSYPYFVKNIDLKSGCEKNTEEVVIILPTDEDFRKLPHTNARKIMFMHFLKDIRAVEIRHSMIDEAMCYCANKKEFWIIIKSLARQK